MSLAHLTARAAVCSAECRRVTNATGTLAKWRAARDERVAKMRRACIVCDAPIPTEANLHHKTCSDACGEARVKEKQYAWNASNSEVIKAQRRQRLFVDPTKSRKSNRKYYAKNRDAILARAARERAALELVEELAGACVPRPARTGKYANEKHRLYSRMKYQRRKAAALAENKARRAKRIAAVQLLAEQGIQF